MRDLAGGMMSARVIEIDSCYSSQDTRYKSQLQQDDRKVELFCLKNDNNTALKMLLILVALPLSCGFIPLEGSLLYHHSTVPSVVCFCIIVLVECSFK